jgi:endonuclease/exonuclease/phosphatase family metal-dependent hydrolase
MVTPGPAAGRSSAGRGSQVATIRIMTYNVHRCRGRDGEVDPEKALKVIAEGAPDIVALQEVDAAPERNHLGLLAERLGMQSFGNPRLRANAFLSYIPLKGIQEFTLGRGGCCLRADADLNGKRVHLLNLRFDPNPFQRGRQVDDLLGPELLANRSLVCPTLVLGDFGDWWWGPGNMSLNLVLHQARRPMWRATFPARFPLAGRDRAYLRGEIRVVDAHIPLNGRARRASSHLPLILTVQAADPRNFLRVEKLRHNRMEIAPG